MTPKSLSNQEQVYMNSGDYQTTIESGESRQAEVAILLLIVAVSSTVIAGIEISDAAINYRLGISFSGFMSMIGLSNGINTSLRTVENHSPFWPSINLKGKIRSVNSDVFFHSRVGSSDAQ